MMGKLSPPTPPYETIENGELKIENEKKRTPPSASLPPPL